MKKSRLLVLLTLICLLVVLIPLAVSAETPTNGWYTPDGGDTYYYYQNGMMVTDTVLKIGNNYYGFDWSGEMYEDVEFWCNGYSYRAKPSGVLYVNLWYEAQWGEWYYYGAEGKGAEDFTKISNTWYFFEGARMVTDQMVWSNDYEAYYAISEDGTKSVALTGRQVWKQLDGDYYYVKADGEPARDEILKIGNTYYAFTWIGQMVNADYYWIDGAMRRAKAGGALYVYSWYEDSNGEWYYYGAEGAGLQDFQKIGDAWYFFNNEGRMIADEVVWSEAYDRHYLISPDGAQSVVITKEGWLYAFGEYYYVRTDTYGNPEMVQDEMFQVSSVYYYFHGNGKMAHNELVFAYHPDVGDWNTYIFTASGALLTNNWESIDGDWYYAKADGTLCYDEIYEIGGKLYYFDYDNCMYDIPGEAYLDDREVYVTASGALYRNQWYEDRTCDEYMAGWTYFGNNGARLMNTVVKIGGVPYGFDYNGVMRTNEVYEYDNVVYVFDANGKGTVTTGWFYYPGTTDWMYATSDGLANGLMKINGVTYGFENGYMVTNNYVWHYDFATDAEEAYLFDGDGKLITKTGWNKLDGSWYYVESSNGKLATGWKSLSGKWYYFTPQMRNNSVFYDYEYGQWYAVDNDGVCTKLSGTGFYTTAWYRVYLENGVPATGWRQIGGAWYYFDYEAMAYFDGIYTIDDKYYLFDIDGKLSKGGWYFLGEYDGTCYAGTDGIVYTGVKNIGGKNYLFDENGRLVENYTTPYMYEGKWYLLTADGTVRGTISKEGWNQVGSDWYYVENGELVRYALRTIDGVQYGFDGEGKMCKDGICYAWYDWYMFDANGVVMTGWQYVDGAWRYANPDDTDPKIIWDGLWYIDDKSYVFQEGRMQTGTVIYGDTLYTTDSAGVVQSETPLPDGWHYVDGAVIYKQDGRRYTGWVGNYYVEDGRMYYNQVIEYNGSYYFLDVDGRYLRNGWKECSNNYNYYGDSCYIYAKADGTLYCNEWAQIGGVWYYFSDYRMLCDGIWEIDGEYHEFAQSGKWLGKVELEENEELPTKGDGWQYFDGAWHYYHAGQALEGTYYIDGTFYAFDWMGQMVTNRLWDGFYYTSSGARANYTGWKKLNGTWHYFDADSCIVFGWIKSGSGWYYTIETYDEDQDAWICDMLTDTYLQYGCKLYYFDENGYSAGQITANGWYQADGDWYYFENGSLIGSGYREIGGVGYYFYSGRMLVNGWIHVEKGGAEGIIYFGANGAAITKAGWYQVEQGWIYVGTDGMVYANGIYKIGGKDYCFCDGIWIQ